MTATPVHAPRTPREILAAYRQAMLDGSADALASLYAPDAVHEFPFTAPGFPPRFEGRDQIYAAYRAAWGASPVEVTAVDEIAVHVDDHGVVIGEQVVHGTFTPTGEPVTLPGVVVLHTRDGLIVRARDYMDALALSRVTQRD